MSCLLLASAGGKVKSNSYSKVSEIVGGAKLRLFLELNLLFYTLGSCISYQIISKWIALLISTIFIVTSLTRDLLGDWGVNLPGDDLA